MMSQKNGTISQIWVYPVKSMRGNCLETANVLFAGLEHDRRYLVVDSNYQFLTQRDIPNFAKFSVQVQSDFLEFIYEEQSFQASFSEMSSNPVPVLIWRDTVNAMDAGDRAANWLSSCLGMDVRLVKLLSDDERQIDLTYGEPGQTVSFADGYPILLANQASLQDLNSKLESGVPMSRFRPNLVVEGFAPWQEDTWNQIRIGGLRFRVAKPCARCKVITQDQFTGERQNEEPLVTLAKFRNVDSKVLFGENLIPLEEGSISVGDTVEILE